MHPLPEILKLILEQDVEIVDPINLKYNRDWWRAILCMEFNF